MESGGMDLIDLQPETSAKEKPDHPPPPFDQDAGGQPPAQEGTADLMGIGAVEAAVPDQGGDDDLNALLYGSAAQEPPPPPSYDLGGQAGHADSQGGVGGGGGEEWGEMGQGQQGDGGLEEDEPEIRELVAMGFDLGDARAAMLVCNGNVEQAVTMLTTGGLGHEDAEQQIYAQGGHLQPHQGQHQRHGEAPGLEEEPSVGPSMEAKKEAAAQQHGSGMRFDLAGGFGGKHHASPAQEHATPTRTPEGLKSKMTKAASAFSENIDMGLERAEKVLDKKLNSFKGSPVTSKFISGARSWGAALQSRVSTVASKGQGFVKDVAKELEMDHPIAAAPPLDECLVSLQIGRGLVARGVAVQGEKRLFAACESLSVAKKLSGMLFQSAQGGGNAVGEVLYWEEDRGSWPQVPTEHVSRSAFSCAAACGDFVMFGDRGGGVFLCVLGARGLSPAHACAKRGKRVTAMRRLASLNAIAAGSADGSVQVYFLPQGAQVPREGPAQPWAEATLTARSGVTALAADLMGRRVVAGCHDGSIASGVPTEGCTDNMIVLHKGGGGEVAALAVNDQGTLLASATEGDTKIVIWALVGQELSQLLAVRPGGGQGGGRDPTADYGAPVSLAWCGGLLSLAAGLDCGRLAVWSLDDQIQLGTGETLDNDIPTTTGVLQGPARYITAHDSEVRVCEWDARRRGIWTAGDDGLVKLWGATALGVGGGRVEDGAGVMQTVPLL